MSDNAAGLLCVGLVFVIFLLGSWVGYDIGKLSGIKQMRTSAVFGDHAQWIVSDDGTTEFEWLRAPGWEGDGPICGKETK